MGWRDCVSPEQEAEIDGLGQYFQEEKDRRVREWGDLVRKDKTSLSLPEFLDQYEDLKKGSYGCISS
jgi:hypothetical protein